MLQQEESMKFKVDIKRDGNGIPHITAVTEEELYFSFGYAHAMDRGMEMIFMKTLGQGRLSEQFQTSDANLAIDTFFRKMNWMGEKESDKQLTSGTANLLEMYTAGINAAFEKKLPWELKLLPYTHEPWRVRDSQLLIRILGYVSLSQAQDELERFFIEMVQAGVPDGKLEDLFPGLLEGYDRDLIEKVSLNERMVPNVDLWNVVPRLMASNSWVLSGKKTQSGKPILSNDIHLECNRIPAIWYEIVFDLNGRSAMGGTMPGIPGLLVGRTSDLAWGVTYSFMDTVDSWVEQCKDGAYYRKHEGWIHFRKREEVIKGKKGTSVTVTFYENDHGILDGDPNIEGYYLSTRWSGADSGAVSLNMIPGLLEAETVDQGMDLLGRLESTWSWVLADKGGNIGFQMSGLMPKRRKGIRGIVPLAGWDKNNDWDGFIDYKKLPRIKNPKQGFFVTANNDLNEYGKAKPIPEAMGPYRAERIQELLEEKDDFTCEDMKRIQSDLYSNQASRFMEILIPLLPETKQGRILKEWDKTYSLDSKGAYLFEQFYRELLLYVFGDLGFGRRAVEYLHTETGTFISFYHCFDRVLLKRQSPWFGGSTRDQVFRQVAEKALKVEPKPWKAGQKFVIKHILFGDTPLKILGFNRGPYYLPGGRSTVRQGQIYRSGNRDTTFSPAFRMIIDFQEESIHTNMPGGPSEHRFSRWYDTDIRNWLKGIYKTIIPKPEEKTHPFP